MRDIWRKYKIWLYRLFIATFSVVIIMAFVKPWWSVVITIVGQRGIINIYGWGIPQHVGIFKEIVAHDVTPIYQTSLAWSFAILIAIIALITSWLKPLKGQVILGFTGIATLSYALVAVFVVISDRLQELSVALLGSSAYPGGVTINAELISGFYLACIAGTSFIILALIRPLFNENKRT